MTTTDKVVNLKIVDRVSEAAKIVQEDMEKLKKRIDEGKIVAYALVMIRDDGATFVSTRSTGNRVMLLGCVADLQYTLAKDGDEPAENQN